MGLMVVHGAQGGGFSPISIYGGITNQVVKNAGLPGDEIVLFLSSLAFNAAVALVIFFVFGGHRLPVRRPAEDLEAWSTPCRPAPRFRCAAMAARRLGRPGRGRGRCIGRARIVTSRSTASRR